jgi:hypothetical protein
MTGAEMVEEARRHLMSMSTEEINFLAADITAVAQTLTFSITPAPQIRQGAYLAIDWEIIQVMSVSGTTAALVRARLGSTGAAHTAAGSLLSPIYVNPRFPAFSILRALDEEIRSYSSPRHGLYQVRTTDVTYNAARQGYDFPATDLIDVIDVRYADHGPGYGYPRIGRWSVARNMPTSDFASGMALILHGGAAPGRNIRVVYKSGFSGLTTANVTTDAFTSTGLPTTAHDIPALGAAARLIATREARRSFIDTQPEARQAADVPPGAARSAAAALLMLRDARLREEAARLQAAYPTLSRVS